MKIAILHSGNQGFFPRFYNDLSLSVNKIGDEIRLFSPRNGINIRNKLSNQCFWGSRINWHCHYWLYKFTGLMDNWSYFSTLDLIHKLKKYSPDVIHLNIINDCILNIPSLFKYIKKYHIPVVWTFHDVRAITGRCAYFDEVNCYRWKEGCHDCPKNNPWYSSSFIDNSAKEWKMRKKWVNSLENLTIVTPSKWLATFVSESFLKEKSLVIINNGIDTKMFANRDGIVPTVLDNIKEKIVLAVAAVWNKSKGVDTMAWLSEHLPTGYKVVIIGLLDETIRSSMPPNIICLPKTTSKRELISLYQKASVYVNPTLADNFPTVNIEALSSGIPVVTYNTGGSAECLDKECGISVERGNREQLLTSIIYVCTHPEIYTRENCLKRAENFSLAQFDKYVDLFHNVAINNK